MKTIRRRLIVVATAALLASCVPAFAQEKGQTDSVAKNADEEWTNVLREARNRKATANATGGDRKTANDERVADRLAEAKAFKEFADAKPKHPKAREARRQEALALLRAGTSVEAAVDSRRKQLVSELRGDASLSAAERFEVAATAEHLEVSRRKFARQQERLDAREAVTRSLIQEFPTVDAGYESLLQIAKASPATKALEICADLADRPKTPKAVKAEAERLISRHALVGSSFMNLIGSPEDPASPLQAVGGKNIVLYSWSMNNRPSVELAKRIGAMPLQNSVLIGVCLDSDSAIALEFAKRERLPGQMIAAGTGKKTSAAKRLGMSEPGLVYLVDIQGVVRDVAAHVDPTAAYAKLPTRTP